MNPRGLFPFAATPGVRRREASVTLQRHWACDEEADQVGLPIGIRFPEQVLHRVADGVAGDAELVGDLFQPQSTRQRQRQARFGGLQAIELGHRLGRRAQASFRVGYEQSDHRFPGTDGTSP